MDPSEQALSAKKNKTEKIGISNYRIWDTITNGRLEAVRYLFENGLLDPNQITSGTPLFHSVCQFGNKEIIRLFIEKGAIVDAPDESGRPPLYWASCNGRESIAEILIENGANIDVREEDGWTPLYRACNNEHESFARFWIEKGANIDVQDKWGYTPLYWACRTVRLPIVRLLLEKGANPNIPDNNGCTPIQWACKERFPSVIRLLIAKGAYISADLLKEYPDFKVDRQIQFNRMLLYWIRTRFPDSFLGKDYLPRDMYRLIVRVYIRSEEIDTLSAPRIEICHDCGLSGHHSKLDRACPEFKPVSLGHNPNQ